METKLPEPKPEEKKPLSAEEREKEEKLFKQYLAEFVSSEATFSEQAGRMVKLLDNKLNHTPPFKLNNDERKLLEEARKCYQALAENPYPWFGANTTPDKIREMTFNDQAKLCHDLSEELKNNNTERAALINKRIQLMQWASIQYQDLNRIINTEDKLKLEKDNKFLSIPDADPNNPTNTKWQSDTDVIRDCLITPIQRLPRLPLLAGDLLKHIPPDQTNVITDLKNLQTKWNEEGQQGDLTADLSLSKNKKLANDIKKIPITKIPYVVSLLEKELKKRAPLAKQLEETQRSIEASKKKNESDKIIKKKKKAVKNFEKKIKPVDEILEKKIKAINTLSTQELELFSAADPKSTSAFLKRDDVIKLTTDIRHHQKEITQLFGKEAYENVNNLAKARSAISDKAFELLINPDSQTTLTSLQPNELVKLTLDVRLHQTKITQLFRPQDYQVTKKSLKDANASIESNESYHQIDRATAKALSTISDKELALCNTSNPKFFLRNLGGIDVFNLTGEVYKQQKDLIHLTADVYVHQEEINLLFSPTILRNTRQALEKNNDPKITKAFHKLSDDEINLFRGEKSLKATFNSLNTEQLGELNLAVRSHRQELIFLFGKDAYQETSKAFAKEYPQKFLKANEKALEKFSSTNKQEHDNLLEKNASLLNLIQQKEYSSLSHQEIDKLSNQEIKLFTASKPEDIRNILRSEAPNIDALVKLSKNIRSHRQEITHIFGKEAYQDMGKAFVEHYKGLKDAIAQSTQHKGHRWFGYTHEQKAEAAGALLEAIGTSAKKLDSETINILKKGKLCEIAEPLMEAEKEKSTPAEPSPTPRPHK